MKWTLINPEFVDKKIFCFEQKIIACKVARWNSKSDVRTFFLKGWSTFASLTDIDPITNKKLKTSEWFIFAGKGE